MSNKAHDEQLAKDVKDKIEELTFAHYQGDVKQLLVLAINKDGQTQTMRAYDSLGLAALYLTLGMVQREMEAIIAQSTKVMKPRE